PVFPTTGSNPPGPTPPKGAQKPPKLSTLHRPGSTAKTSPPVLPPLLDPQRRDLWAPPPAGGSSRGWLQTGPEERPRTAHVDPECAGGDPIFGDCGGTSAWGFVKERGQSTDCEQSTSIFLAPFAPIQV
ncbi:hypothetical protein JTE90_022566, partial [Oedothorax gibbosus]